MCNFCGESDGCKMVGGNAFQYSFNVSDWEKLYRFMRFVYLPFIHSLVIAARFRDGTTYSISGKPRKITEREMKNYEKENTGSG